MKRFMLYVGTALLLTVGTVWAGPSEEATDAYQRGDYATAFKIIQPLAAQGDTGAQYNLGAMYLQGHEVPLPGVSLHTLRHTLISRLVQAGRPLPEVAALAGHRDIKMTLRYSHLAPSHLRAGIQALEERTLRHEARPGLSTEPRVTPVSQDF